MQPRVLHHEIDKLALLHEVEIKYPLRKPEDRLALAESMDEIGLATRNGTIGYGPQLLLCADFTIGFKHTYSKMTTTARLRTPALHFHFGAAFRRMRRAVARLPWVERDPHLGEIHLCADIMGQQIGPEEIDAFDDQTGMRLDAQGSLRDCYGRPVVGGKTYEWKQGGDTLIQVYDKKIELHYNTKKASYMRPLYMGKGWDGTASLTRVEVKPNREQIAAAYTDKGDIDLTAMWRACLQGLRFTEGDASVEVAKRPTAPWWNSLLDLEFSLRTTNPPLAAEHQRMPLRTELSQAEGSVVGYSAKMLVLHAAHPDLLPPLPYEKITRIISTAECIRPKFAAVVRKKALSMGLSRGAALHAGWPEAFAWEVFGRDRARNEWRSLPAPHEGDERA